MGDHRASREGMVQDAGADDRALDRAIPAQGGHDRQVVIGGRQPPNLCNVFL
jgi:hypothetical protein